MDETCGEVVYKNGEQMIRNMSCHRCKNRKTLCHLCTQSVFHRVCNLTLFPPHESPSTITITFFFFLILLIVQICEMCMQNYYHINTLAHDCPLCNKTCRCPSCRPRSARDTTTSDEQQ